MSELMADPPGPVAGGVVGIPGPVDYARGQPLKLANLPLWEGRISAEGLSDQLGLPILLANDADLAALGEHRFGAGRGYADMAYVTASTGVGAAAILGERLVSGRLSLAELGHTVIDRTSGETVETLGSGTALARLAGEDGAVVAAKAKAGDNDALRQFKEIARDLAIGVFNFVQLFSPEIVVIGGGMSEAGDLLLDPIRAKLRDIGPGRLSSIPDVVRAVGGDDAGLRGAAAYWGDFHQGPGS